MKVHIAPTSHTVNIEGPATSVADKVFILFDVAGKITSLTAAEGAHRHLSGKSEMYTVMLHSKGKCIGTYQWGFRYFRLSGLR